MDTFVGSLVYFRCPKRSWILGNFEEWIAEKKLGTCRAKDGNDVVAKLAQDDIHPAKEDTLNEDVPDLLHLTELHDATLLHCLKRRYLRDVIYTNIGAIVVALNPFNFKIPTYTDDKMVHYLAEGEVIEKNVPHSWAQAHNTYYEMRNDSMNQCILVSGESGAGKTEASKIVMKYLASVSCLRGSDEQKSAAALVGTKINKCSPPLEAFGNAKTVRNDNSSRFGKFMKVQFDQGGFLVGAHITKYLLEKSRIVSCCDKERVYHAFYLILRGKDRGLYGLNADDTMYKTIVSEKTNTITPNKEFDTAADYDEVVQGMLSVGIKQESVSALWSVVAGILNFENVLFESDGGEGSVVSSDSSRWLEQTYKLWEVNPDMLRNELTTTTLNIAGKEIVKLLNPAAAMDGRSALSKALYDATFSWLVEQCNRMLNNDACASWIGLLDIFGFEDFEKNSFEQVCINLANETLQGHYNTYIFQKDMDECRAEGVDVADVPFPDNTPCLNLLMGKGGILAMLDEECQLGKGSDLAFLDKIAEKYAKDTFFEKKQLAKSSFIIKHYAGNVSYEVEAFREKNMDTLKDAWKLLLRASANPFHRELLPSPSESGPSKVTVGAFFKNQLFDLMRVINTTNPHWIRCVKPHPAKKPLMFDGVTTMNQLSSSGVLGTVKIRKAGYAVRIYFEDFVAKYKIIAVSAGGFNGTPKSIVDACGYSKSEAQVGRTRVFLRSHIYMDIEGKKKAALAASTKVVHAFAKSLVDISMVKNKVMESNKSVVESLRFTVLEMLRFQWSEENTRQEVTESEEKLWEELMSFNADRIAKVDAEVAAERERRRRQIMEELKEKHAMEREVLEEEHMVLHEGLASEWWDEYLLIMDIFEFDRQKAHEREYRRLEHEALEAQKKINAELRAKRESHRELLVARLVTTAEKCQLSQMKHKTGPSEKWLLQKQGEAEYEKKRMEEKAEKLRNKAMQIVVATTEPKKTSTHQDPEKLRQRRAQTFARVQHRKLVEERYTVERRQDFEIERVERDMLRKKANELHQQRLEVLRTKDEMERNRWREAKELEHQVTEAHRRALEIGDLERSQLKDNIALMRRRKEGEYFTKKQTQIEKQAQKVREEQKLQSRFYNDTLAEKVSIERPGLKASGEYSNFYDIPLRDRVPHVDPFVMARGKVILPK